MLKLCLLAGAALALVLALSGCGERDEPVDTAPTGEPLYAETVSPNQDYVEDEKDVVHYTVQIYQEADGTISVRADSNSAFFEQLSYDVSYNRTITKENIRVEWLTLAGGTEPTAARSSASGTSTSSARGFRRSLIRSRRSKKRVLPYGKALFFCEAYLHYTRS